MLRLQGVARKRCDGISRRDALRIGAAGVGGFSLPHLLRAEQLSGAGTGKSVVFIHLDGGPPQHETIDPKPLAPVEIRGEFNAIETAMPGVFVSELMPQVAQRVQQFALLRCLTGSVNRHDAFQCQSGFDAKDLASLGGRPAFGSVASKFFSRPDSTAPVFVDMMQGRPLARNSARPGFLGPAHQPFRPDLTRFFDPQLSEAMEVERARNTNKSELSLTLDGDLTVDRLDDRTQLLRQFDRLRREVDSSGMMDAMDEFHRQAAGILTSGTLARALDLDQEDPRLLQRFTATCPTPRPGNDDADSPKKLLLARRLLQAGVRVVSVSFGNFDTHSSNGDRLKRLMPIVDHALAAFVDDLKEQGMLDDVLIVAWGEFGRTPKINASGGRDHWPRLGPALMAGGGLKTGQVLGETDRHAADVLSGDVSYQDVFATLYHQLGVDPHHTTLIDPQGRPQHLLNDGQPIRAFL